MQRYIGIPTHLRGHARWSKSGAAVAKEFVAKNQGKHFCQCGCKRAITIKRHHHSLGVSRFIPGHRVKNPLLSGETAKEREKDSRRLWYERYRLKNGIQPRRPAMTAEERRERNREKYQENKERLRERSREYARTHRKEAVARASRWSKENLARAHANKFKYKQARKGSEGSFKATEWESLKEKYGYRCLKCGKKEPDIVLRPDHVIPVSKGGSSYISNIQPLCHSCNCAKGNRNDTDYRI